MASSGSLKAEGASTRVILLRSKKTKTVMYMEAGKEFVDLLFGFLTLPTANVLKLLDEGGCLKQLGAAIANVFTSVKDLEDSNFYVNKDVLLNPKAVCSVMNELPNSFLKIEASPVLCGPRRKCYRCKCYSSFSTSSSTVCNDCSNYTNIATEINAEQAQPAAPQPAPTAADKSQKVGFVKNNLGFLITDDLHISSSSTLSTIGLLSKLEVETMTDLESVKISVGPREAFQLLQASFCKRGALNDVFGP